MRSTHVLFTAIDTVVLAEEDVPDGDLAPMEVLLRTEASLVSAGTELARLKSQGEAVGQAYPVRSGYACIGRVLAVGSAVADLAIGQRVFYAGKHQAVQRFLHGQDHQWGRCYPVPDGIPSEDAVFVCLAQIAQTAPWVATAGPEDTVAVFGLGLIGTLAAQLYRLRGATVVGIDPVLERRALAMRCGISRTLSRRPDEPFATVTVDATGRTEVIAEAVRATLPFGQVALLGTPRVPCTLDATELFLRIHEQGLVVRGAHMWRFPATASRGTARTVADAYAHLFACIADGRLDVAPLRSHLAPPSEAPRLYRDLDQRRDTTWGVVIDWR